MRTFRVNVNGNTYEVQLEEISASEMKNTSASAQKTSAPQSAQGRAVNAPIAGTVLSVNVSSGQSQPSVPSQSVSIPSQSVSVPSLCEGHIHSAKATSARKGLSRDTVFSEETICIPACLGQNCSTHLQKEKNNKIRV